LTPETQTLVTQWLQGFASSLAIPASIFAFIKLFRRDTQKEAEIESLIQMARNSSHSIQELQLQSAEFKKQTKIMAEANSIMETHLALLAKNNETDIATRKQILEVEILKRRNQIKPWLNPNGGEKGPNHRSTRLKNIGKMARYRGYKEILLEDTSIINQPPIHGPVGENEFLSFNFKRNNPTESDMMPKLEIKIFIEDLDKNIYSQNLKSIDGNFNITDPILEISSDKRKEVDELE
jgi:hypothetical protein